jgi:hypothetical protein
MKPMKRPVEKPAGRLWNLRVLFLVLALSASGCTKFERQWSGKERAAAVGPARAGADAAYRSTRWDGRWVSDVHRGVISGEPESGRLRCILTPIDADHYHAQFKANWLWFSSGYSTVLKTTGKGRTRKVAGEHRLSAIFGGVYKYWGTIGPDRFSLSYTSSYDRGRFDLAPVRE